MNIRGRKPLEDPRIYGYRLRLNKKELSQIQYLISKDIEISSILRSALEICYEEKKGEEQNGSI